MKLKRIIRGVIRFIESLRNPKRLVAFIVCIAIVSISIFVIANRPTDVDKISMDYGQVFDTEVISENVTSKFKDTYELKDYSIYGENLMLYEHTYSSDTTDSLQGRNVVLRNIETENEINFTFSGGVDSGISLSSLDEGMYEVFVYDHYIKKRVYFSDAFDMESFTTMRRNEHVKSISLHAYADYLSELGINYQKNYLFITVFENVPMANTVDVVLDPRGLINNPQTNEVDYGVSNDDFSEAKESYQFAEMVKAELENRGLKVVIDRAEDESLSYYGKKGRVGIGYEQNAKLFLSFGMTSDDTIVHPYFVTSPYTGALLANELAYSIKSNGIELESVSTLQQLQEGVMFDSLMIDDYGYTYPYEMYPQLRESGGKCTFAGGYDVSTENERYSQSNGMYGLYLVLANVNSKDSIQYYTEHKDTLAIELADGICTYYQIENNEK